MAKSIEPQQIEVTIERKEINRTPVRVYTTEPILLNSLERYEANKYMKEYVERFWVTLYLIEKYHPHDICIEPLFCKGSIISFKERIHFFNPEISLNIRLDEALKEIEPIIYFKRMVEILEGYLQDKGWIITYDSINQCGPLEFNNVLQYKMKDIIINKNISKIASIMQPFIHNTMLQPKRILTQHDVKYVDELLLTQITINPMPLVTVGINSNMSRVVGKQVQSVTVPFRCCSTNPNQTSQMSSTLNSVPSLINHNNVISNGNSQWVRGKGTLESPMEIIDKKEDDIKLKSMNNSMNKEIRITIEPKKPIDVEKRRERNRKWNEMSVSNQEDTYWTLIYLLTKYDKLIFELDYEIKRKNTRERGVKKIKRILAPEYLVDSNIKEMLINTPDLEPAKRRNFLINNLLLLAEYYHWDIIMKSISSTNILEKRGKLKSIQRDTTKFIETDFSIISKEFNKKLENFVVIKGINRYYLITPKNIEQLDSDICNELNLNRFNNQVEEKEELSDTITDDSDTVDDPLISKN